MKHSGPLRTLGFVATGAGSLLILIQMAIWSYVQGTIWTIGGSAAAGRVVSFFLLESICLVLIVAGGYSLYKSVEGETPPGDGTWNVADVIRSALDSRRDVRVGVLGGLLYAGFYAVVSSIIVYQPTVDFAQAYGAASPSWNAVSCCGSFGSIPMIVAYLAPQLHLGIQLIPVDLLLLVVIPILVAFNSTIASFAFRNRPRGPARVWLGGLGAAVALFTSCPTCAGYFLGSTLGGLAATSLALALAPYQVAFILVSIPVLLVSPLVVARGVGKTLQAECKI